MPRSSRLAALAALALLAGCGGGDAGVRERTEQGWALVVGDGLQVGCCSDDPGDPGGPGYSLRAAHWRDATDDRPSPWYEPGPVPSCLQQDRANLVRLRVLDVPARGERPATSVVVELECLDHAPQDVLEQAG